MKHFGYEQRCVYHTACQPHACGNQLFSPYGLIFIHPLFLSTGSPPREQQPLKINAVLPGRKRINIMWKSDKLTSTTYLNDEDHPANNIAFPCVRIWMALKFFSLMPRYTFFSRKHTLALYLLSFCHINKCQFELNFACESQRLAGKHRHSPGQNRTAKFLIYEFKNGN